MNINILLCQISIIACQPGIFCVETNTKKIEKKTYKKGPLALFQEIMTLHGAMKMVLRSQLPSLKVRCLRAIVLESLQFISIVFK